ncbi:MAG: hypothetical protein J0I07_39150 [Myxococcales bacterium]|nr:hypothetical protein [Myxococcales bacterium]
MRNVFFPLAFISCSTLVACSFQMRAGTGANEPTTPQTATSTPATAATTAPAATTAKPSGPAVRRLGKRTAGQPTGPTPTPSSTSTTPTVPTGGHVVSGATIFGSGTVDATGFKGNIYWVDSGATKVPALGSMTPAGYLFTKELNITPQAFSTGFPGVDAARKENFAIRYEAPLVVTEAADYDFRLVAEDGAILQIDGMTIVDNDGVKTAPGEKTGPVHLVAGTHVITVDYLQTTGNVALQLFCTKANDTEKVCPTRL